jgi:hypothetical protein
MLHRQSAKSKAIFMRNKNDCKNLLLYPKNILEFKIQLTTLTLALMWANFSILRTPLNYDDSD